MPQGTPQSGLVGELGLSSRREDPLAYQRAWNAANRERLNAYHRAYHQAHKNDPHYMEPKKQSDARSKRKAKFGIDDPVFKRMLTAQDNACRICHEPFTRTPHVDHDHADGHVRGLLCSRCNYGLGNFRDNIGILTSAIEYLQRQNREQKQ